MWGLALVLPVVLFDPVRQTFPLGQVNIILALMIVADLTMDRPCRGASWSGWRRPSR